MTALLKTSQTPTALWFDIVHEAEMTSKVSLNEELEAYLVFLLYRYLNQPEMVNQIMASEFLDGLSLLPHAREGVLQGVGDKCLLFSGLFPHLAIKRLVKINYFIQLGQTAYDVISKKQNDLYYLLAKEFVSLMDVLQSIRFQPEGQPDLTPFEAYDLWNESGSQRALHVLAQYTNGIVVPTDGEPH